MKSQYFPIKIQRVILILVLCTCSVVHAKLASNAEIIDTPKHITPAHVHALSRLVGQEIEQIRKVMGRPGIEIGIATVENAQPREVYFQAVNLFGKIGRMRYELTFSKPTQDKPVIPDNIKPESVWKVLIFCLDNLYAIMQFHAIDRIGTLPDIDSNSTPSSVYNTLLLETRQINALLESPYLPSNVYEEITNGLYLTLNLQKVVHGLRLKRPPSFVPNKRPKDVFNELLSIYSTIETIFDLSNIKTLSLSPNTAIDHHPSDVYDIAILISSQLFYLNKISKQEESIQRAIYPGIKFPSHVFQRAKFLHLHLREIRTIMKGNSRIFLNPL